MIILDTNVISEIIKKQPDEHVANWLRNQDTSNLATTAITSPSCWPEYVACLKANDESTQIRPSSWRL